MDRESFTRLAAVALEDYQVETLRALADPKVGLISSCRFMPSIAEMREFCRTYVNPSYKEQPKQIASEKPLISDQDLADLKREIKEVELDRGSIDQRAWYDINLELRV